MKTLKNCLLALAVAALLCSWGPVAFAQVNGMEGGVPTGAGAPPVRGALEPSDSPLERLQAQLSLRPEQMALWRAFTNRIDAYVGLHLREKPAMANSNESAPRQIARQVDVAQNRLAAMEEIEDAARHLYDVLDVAQKKKADEFMFAAVPTFVQPAGGAERPATERRDRGRRGSGEGGGGAWGGGIGAGGASRSMP